MQSGIEKFPAPPKTIGIKRRKGIRTKMGFMTNGSQKLWVMAKEYQDS